MRTLIPLMLFSMTPVVAVDFENGLSAFDVGKYRKGFQFWEPLAELGEKYAQAKIAMMYQKGLNVFRNPVKAFGWHKNAAKQGVARSQAVLGSMYGQGDGVLRDYMQAYSWSSIAAAQGGTDAKVNNKISGNTSVTTCPSAIETCR